MAIDQILYMNASTIRTLSNKLGTLKLTDIQGEHVPTLSQTVLELTRQLDGSGNRPSDLLSLVSKPFTTGTVEQF